MAPLKWIEINLEAIRFNIAWVKRRLAPGVRFMAVVKANAYGHGAVPVARLAVKAGASCLGVLTVEEALELRRARITAPIVLLSPPLVEDARTVVRERLEPAIHSLQLASALDRASRGDMRVHVDADFGLHRWGLPPSGIPGFIKRLKKFRKLRLAGLSTHIDYVPGRNAVEAENKLHNFRKLASWIRREHPGVLCHAANSSILLDFPQWQMDMARIGNLLYGVNPTKTEAPLKNPWRFYARIISISEVGKGSAVGYASEFVAPRRMRIAALPVGYADGLTMEPAERLIGFGKRFQYWGMLKGRPAPFVGRCGISTILTDVSRIPQARVGDAVSLPIRRTAANPRVPRAYTNRQTPASTS